MTKQYVVITEIFFNNEKISRSRMAKDHLSKIERDQLIRTIFYSNYGKMNAMDLYSYICITFKEKYDLDLSERTVMRAISAQY